MAKSSAAATVFGELSPRANSESRKAVLVIGGAALGTLFEWYDFFIYGTLASYIARHFFAGVNEASAFIFALATFAAGPAVRPLGALVFGRFGDLVGRKRTFVATMSIMGLATFLVGLLPGFAAIGVAAPILLVALRMLQGLALGGEYGGAAVYVAEHAPSGRRGLHTSWINVAAPGGLIIALLVVIGFRLLLSEKDFDAWGWRAPFLISILLLAISLWIRLKLGESPVFAQMKASGLTSRAPLAEAFGRWGNLKPVLLALILSAGQGAISYAAEIYTLFFLERVLKVEGLLTDTMMAVALLIAAPSFVFFGWLSDKIGRRPVLLAGLFLFALGALPAFHMLTAAANPALATAQTRAPVAVYANPATCSLQFDPVGANRFDRQSCDIAKAYLSRASVGYRNVWLPRGAPTELHVGKTVIRPPELRDQDAKFRAHAIRSFNDEAAAALKAVGYPSAADPARIDVQRVIGLVVFLVLTFGMTYGPLAACLVELFPARIRYTSLSLPYHVGNGWIGGFLPATAFAIVTATGNIYSGLWYPIVFAAAAAVLCVLFLPETRGRALSN